MRTAIRDLALLFVMCVVLYCTGLDTHGVTNWQEAQRVVVAREMQRRVEMGEAGAWTLPRHNEQPYVAKPPMIYWVTVGIAEARGGRVELFDLRLAVALAGTCGVLATYLVARGVLRPLQSKWGSAPDERHIIGARWAAVFLATGILYFRSARIGELDVLLAPSVAGAVGCIWMAWRRSIERRERIGERGGAAEIFGMTAHWPSVIAAALLASFAALSKGPPALMVVALGGYGPVIIWACLGERESGSRVASIAAGVVGAVFAGVAALYVKGPLDVLGVAIIGVMGAALGYMLAGLQRPSAWKSLWMGLAHTHPVVVLGAPVLAFWWWWSDVTGQIGPEMAFMLAKEQADNDLNLFQPSSPLKNFEALAYGCGVGSVVMLAGALWWMKFRPGVRAAALGVLVPIAWVVLSYCALSLFGKGVPRYLTPVWPGVAILAGALMSRRRKLTEGRESPRGAMVLWAACVVLGIGQAWWYAHGREVYEHERSPRELMRWLVRLDDRSRFGSFEFYTPALDYYAGAYVQPIVNAQMGVAVAGGPAWTLDELERDVRLNGARIVLCRERSLDASLPSPVERMKAAGLRVEPVEAPGVFRIDNARTLVRAVRVSVD